MPIPRLSIDEIHDHLAACDDGIECKFHVAEEWARTVARPEHVGTVRDLVMALHLADKQAQDNHENFALTGNLLRSLMRRKNVTTIKIEGDEIADQVERLVIEQNEDDSVDVSLVRDPVDDSAGN